MRDSLDSKVLWTQLRNAASDAYACAGGLSSWGEFLRAIGVSTLLALPKLTARWTLRRAN